MARIVSEEIGLGTNSIIAALLHDTIEDTDLKLEDIEDRFDRQIARIIDGLTKIAPVFDVQTSDQAENFRKLLLTLTDDIRLSSSKSQTVCITCGPCKPWLPKNSERSLQKPCFSMRPVGP